MNSDITQVLLEIFRELTSSVPFRSVSVLLHLLLGILLNSGHVSEALLTHVCTRHWTSYYKWLRQGRWSYLSVARACLKLVVKRTKNEWITLAIDDTVIYRKSRHAPRVGVLHEHSKKANRPRYVNGQCLVSLCCVVRNNLQKVVALPILHFIARRSGNRNKLVAAQVLYRSIQSIVSGYQVRVLLDAWYMKARLLEYFIKEGVEVIGQVRRDTAFYHPPGKRPKGKRGRNQKKGQKVSLAEIDKKRFESFATRLYGREVIVHYYSMELLARFLHYTNVRVVWSRIEDIEKEEISKTKVFLCTNPQRKPWEVVLFYEQRWSVEPLFKMMKYEWGFAKAWQQTTMTLARWFTLLSVAYFIPAYLLAFCPTQAAELARIAPWRRGSSLTIGTITQGLRKIIVTLGISDQITKTLQNKPYTRSHHPLISTQKAA